MTSNPLTVNLVHHPALTAQEMRQIALHVLMDTF